MSAHSITSRGLAGRKIPQGTLTPMGDLLFSASEQGVWYDPSDMSTMYQDAAGTTPCYQPGQGQVDPPVGRILDKSGRGNHATQPTTTSRPTLSARYNLLVSSENPASGWSIFDGAFTQAGDYWKFTENTTANQHSFLQPSSQPKAALYRATFTGKPAGRSIVRFVLNAYSGNFAEVRFDLAAGTVVGVFTGGDGVVSSYSIAPAGDGGYSCTIVGKPSAAAAGTGFDVSLGLVEGVNSSYTGDGVSGILVNKFDCRSASDGVGLPPYQRVVDANTYDTVGFPLYLKFDGVDDFLQTASVDFSGTDKLFASAALRKLSDAAAGIVVELSLVSNSNPGAFALLAPSGATPTMGVYLRGATTLVTNTLYGIASPASGVLTGVFDLVAITQQSRSRINGQPAGGSASSDVGGGVFGSYPLYVGKRGVNASTMFNGRLYGLLIRGAATTDATIATVERYLNSKARAY